MIYDLDIPLIIRRYSPTWFRHAPNVEFATTLCGWLARIHARFLLLRANDVLPLFRYNGLVHSLEWMLNDAYDPIDRRIHIHVLDQDPHYYHAGLGGIPGVAHLGLGDLSGYYHLDTTSGPGVYTHEFIVDVPQSIGFAHDDMFRKLDLYRYAGRRPAIRMYDPLDDSTAAFYLHPSALDVPANHP